jgi:hypothetical protein
MAFHDVGEVEYADPDGEGTPSDATRADRARGVMSLMVVAGAPVPPQRIAPQGRGCIAVYFQKT